MSESYSDGSVSRASSRLLRFGHFKKCDGGTGLTFFDAVMLGGAVLVSKLKVEPVTLPFFPLPSHTKKTKLPPQLKNSHCGGEKKCVTFRFLHF